MPRQEKPRSNGNGRKPRARSGGPHTRTGKETSSQNATKHGCCSNRLILANESEEDWNALRLAWMEDYEPQTHVGRTLVYEAAQAQWMLLRARRAYHDTAQELHAEQADPLRWTDEQHTKMARFARYQTTHERAFSRALSNLEQLRRSRSLEAARARNAERRAEELEWRRRKEDERDRAREMRENADPKETRAAKTPAQQLFQGQNHAKKRRKIPVMEQWVEVTVEDGATVTTLYPPNEVLIREGKAMDPPPELVYRRLYFVNGIPPEYLWAVKQQDTEKQVRGGSGVQRMTVDTWLEVIEREKASGSPHLGPTGVGNLPRPRDRGGCDCEVCTKNLEILEGVEEDGGP